MEEIQSILPRRSSRLLPSETRAKEATRAHNQQHELTRTATRRRQNPLLRLEDRVKRLQGKRSKGAKILDNYLDFVADADHPEQKMLKKALRKVEREYLNGKRAPSPRDLIRTINASRHTIPKTGSKLEVIYDVNNPENPINGVFINTIPTSSARIWENLATGKLRAYDKPVPVAPILMKRRKNGEITPRIRHGKNSQSIVISRYCGISLDNLEDGLVEDDGFNPELNRIKLPYELNWEIFYKCADIMNQLGELGIDHGHMTPENFTYELISKKWLEEQFEHGENINTVSYNPDAWSFNINDKIEYPEDWEVVVRLIDFDRAREMGSEEERPLHIPMPEQYLVS